MDIELVEKLAPHLAWPLVALVALPFLVWKVGQLSKLLVDYRKATTELPATLEGLGKLASQLASAEGQLSRVNQSVDQLNARQITDDSADIEAVTEHEADGPPQNEFQNLAAEDLMQKLEDMDTSWRGFLLEFDNAFDRAGLEKPDKRQVGAAAVELKDGRRRNHLEDADVKLIARLHGMHMGFRRRNNEQIGNWLTSTVYNQFMEGVTTAMEKIESFSSARP